MSVVLNSKCIANKRPIFEDGWGEERGKERGSRQLQTCQSVVHPQRNQWKEKKKLYSKTQAQDMQHSFTVIDVMK